ncbi:hypothetical protein KY313_00255 [Candidatus Woesearchaeota archaeon]|jgi:uncharacterized protein|nr:hypothetical protein [Candidatus Woesearchaeota archaeon]
MQKIALILIFTLLILVPTITATTGHMKLLAVIDPETKRGGIADLYLTIKEGEGRVFLDTSPLTKIDTQMSTRMAKEIACEFLEHNCEKKDFFYTIRSTSPIVGGPSAGAAISVLTIALLENLNINEEVSITGTINSGGIIGPVGGLKAKIEIASKKGIKKVLIPKTSLLAEENDSITLQEFANNLSIELKEVGNLHETLYEFTGKRYKRITKPLEIDPIYQQTMKNISIKLCDKTTILIQQVKQIELTNTSRYIEAINLTESAELARNKSLYYPAASYCFGANIKLRNILTETFNRNKIVAELNNLKSEIKEFENNLDRRKINTITDLQTKIIVKERLLDAKDYLTKGFEQIGEDDNSAYNLAYAIERFYSAVAWSGFFDKGRKTLKLKSSQIRDSCLNKISEAEERYQYVKLITPFPLDTTRRELDYAYKHMEENNNELCIFKASKAKAELDVTLSAMNVREEKLGELIDEKLRATEEQITQETDKGRFPILGYSYYLYAKDLKETNKVSALIYAELALELSNMWPYFKEQTIYNEKTTKNLKSLQVFIGGILIGMLIMLGPILIQKIKPKKISKRKRK